MADPPMAPVEGLGIDLIQVAHSGCQIPLRGFYEQVLVVVHQTPRIAMPVLLGNLTGQSVDIALAIRVVGHNRLTRVPACRDVVDGTRKL